MPRHGGIWILPESEGAKVEFESSRRFDFTAKGALGLIVFGALLSVAFVVFGIAPWYTGIAVLILGGLVFLWSPVGDRAPTR